MSARKPKSRYHHGSLREAALAAAARDINVHGHHGFTLERVAKPLGVTPAALYRHFRSREALLSEFLWTTFLRFEQGMDAAALAPGGPADVLLRCAEFYFAFSLDNPGWHRLQFSKTGIAMSERQVKAQPKYFDAMLGALRTLTHPLDDAELLTRYLSVFAIMHGIASLSIEGVAVQDPAPEALRATAHTVLSSFIASLASAGAARAQKKKPRATTAARRSTRR